MQGIPHYGPPIGTPLNEGVSVSQSGNILESTYQIPGTNVGNSVSVYNINTQMTTDLSTLPALMNNGYSSLVGLAIDDDGRILLEADHQTASGGSNDLVLLTPAGISNARSRHRGP